MNLDYFQLVDGVRSLNLEAREITCDATVPTNSTIFHGHFPGHPLMPGTLLIESMAQTCGFLLLRLQEFERLPFLIQVEKAKIRSFVEPGTALLVHGRLEHEGSGFAVASAHITRDGKPLAEADLRFRTVPFPSESLKKTVRDYASMVGAV